MIPGKHTKPLLGVLGGLLISLAGWAGSQHVQRVDRIEQRQMRTEPKVAKIEEATDNLKEDVKEIKEGVRDIQRTLTERRR